LGAPGCPVKFPLENKNNSSYLNHMPELPEVDLVCQQLAKLTEDQPVLNEIQFSRKDLRSPMPIAKLKAMEGQQLKKISRRAKYIIFEFAKDGILSHLGMTGVWEKRTENPKLDKSKHEHILLQFSSGLNLVYRDPRRFGVFDFIEKNKFENHKSLKLLGVEPLSAEFTAEWLFENLKNKNKPIKNAIMDQGLVVGIGNIYAAEILFLSGIRPKRNCSKIKLTECEKICSYAKSILSDSIAKGGSSISDFVSTEGVYGNYQDHHRVYGRAEKECLVCQTKLRNLTLAGRATVYCSHCQK
jgi:formamidopyrimidine-DNA glycosylase